MRISGRQDDPDHWRAHFGACPTILLNAVPIRHVAEADDVAGCVTIELRDRSGNLLMTDDGSAIRTMTLFGEVKIIGDRCG